VLEHALGAGDVERIGVERQRGHAPVDELGIAPSCGGRVAGPAQHLVAQVQADGAPAGSDSPRDVDHHLPETARRVEERGAGSERQSGEGVGPEGRHTAGHPLEIAGVGVRIG